MTHTTEIIETRKLANGQIAATIRCCGNASTDYVHTMGTDGSQQSRLDNLTAAQLIVAQNHQKQMDLDQQASLLVGTTSDHQL